MLLLHNFTSILSLNALSANFSHSSSLDVSSPSRTRLNELVDIKVRSIKTAFKKATFRQMELVSMNGPTTDPELLLEVRLIFSDQYGTLYVDMTDTWGEWADVDFDSTEWPAGDNSLPSLLNMDIVYADELKKRAGYVQPYEFVDLKWPKGLRIGREQPYYYFMSRKDPKFVYVGVNDRSVWTSLPWAQEGADNNGVSTA